MSERNVNNSAILFCFSSHLFLQCLLLVTTLRLAISSALFLVLLTIMLPLVQTILRSGLVLIRLFADSHDCVPYGDDSYPTLDEVSLSLLLLLVMVLIVFRSIVLFLRFAIGRQIMEKLRFIFVSMT